MGGQEDILIYSSVISLLIVGAGLSMLTGRILLSFGSLGAFSKPIVRASVFGGLMSTSSMGNLTAEIHWDLSSVRFIVPHHSALGLKTTKIGWATYPGIITSPPEGAERYEAGWAGNFSGIKKFIIETGRFEAIR